MKTKRPYRKDYDAVENPLEWPKRFDVSNWMLIGAFSAGERIGGAVGAFDSPGLDTVGGAQRFSRAMGYSGFT